MTNFMKVPAEKFYARHDDFQLMCFMFNTKNISLRESFEKAAGVELGQEGACIGIVGDNQRDVALAKDGLEALSKELRTIHPEHFETITQKVTLIRGK